MSVMVDIPPAIVQEVREYAASHGTSLEGLVRAYLTELTTRKGRARMMGAAAAFARPGLRKREKTAFRQAMGARHAKTHCTSCR